MHALNIIEPTLNDQRGHCFSYIDAITSVNTAGFSYCLWIGTQAKTLKFSNKSLVIKPYFHYKLRKLQLYFLYKKLVKLNRAILVSTAGRIDLILLNRCLKKNSYRIKIFLTFHQLSKNQKKLAQLAQIALNNGSQFVIITTTEKLHKTFEQLGFPNVETVPCPSFSVLEKPTLDKMASQPVKLLYAGIANKAKGFPIVANLVETLNNLNANYPIHIQLTPPSSGRYDSATQEAIVRLKQSTYPQLNLHESTPDKQAFLTQFQNSICLQLYDSENYRDKFSGICLDALLCGAPVITVKNTWMGDRIAKYQAGIVLNNLAMDDIVSAVHRSFEHYRELQNHVLNATHELRNAHHPHKTLETVSKYLDIIPA